MFVSREPLPLLTSKAVAEQPLPPITWVVEPIMAQGERLIFYGEYGSLKSWLLLHLGMHVAAGQQWLSTFPVPTARPVLYVDEEMSEYTLRLRMKRIMAGTGLPPEMPFAAASRVGVCLNEIGASVLLDRLERAEFDPEVIIVESLRRVMPGDEKEAPDVSAFWRHIEPLMKAGKTVLVSHHMRKPRADGPDDPRYRASGNTDLIAGSDAAWWVQRHGMTDACTVGPTRIRLAKEPEPFHVTFDFGATDQTPVTAYPGTPDEDKSQGGRASLIIQERLQASPAPTDELERLTAHETISRATFFRALKSLEDRKVISAIQHGFWQLADP